MQIILPPPNIADKTVSNREGKDIHFLLGAKFDKHNKVMITQ
jgi:hypothetical protein